ncbi:RNA exonuclease 1-like protein [Aphelenchoides fujianensis]|nr:RNA exonuclease 1-like protein [Aphelenchoides fujianensis]
MIPIDSVFSHIACPFGRSCRRPHCRYSHADDDKPPKSPEMRRQRSHEKEAASSASSASTAPAPAARSTSESNGILPPELAEIIAFTNTATFRTASASTAPAAAAPAARQYEQEPADFSAGQYTYRASYNRFGDVNPAIDGQERAHDPFGRKDSRDEDGGELRIDSDGYQPVMPPLYGHSSGPRGRANIQANHDQSTYSALDDRPRYPVDLGDDEILRGIRGVDPKAAKRPAASVAPAPPLSTAARLRAAPSIEPVRRAPAPIRQPHRPTVANPHVAAKSTSFSSISAPRPPLPPTARPHATASHPNIRSTTPAAAASSFVPARAADGERARVRPPTVPVRQASREEPPAVQPVAVKQDGAERTASTSRTQMEVDAIKQPNPRKRAASPIDTEKELREIEILEKKTRLLKEYKQLAEEIALLEGKQGKPDGQAVIDEIEAEVERKSSSSSVESTTAPTRSSTLASSSSSGGKIQSVRRPLAAPTNKLLSASLSVDSTAKPAGGLGGKDLIAPAVRKPTIQPAKASYREVMIGRLDAAAPKKPAINGRPSAPTAAASVPKDSSARRAHVSQNVQILPLEMATSKIAMPVRTRCLRKIFDEFAAHGITQEQAVVMSQLEEKALADRCQTQSGYTSGLAGVVRGIRNKQFTLPSSPTEKVVSVAETMRRKREHRLEEPQFYDHLRSKYLMTAEQLAANGYPLVTKDADGTKRVEIAGAEERKIFNEDDDFHRVCCRCGAEYQLRPNGAFVQQQDCVYHWKRAFKKRINKTLESRYGCCDADLTVKGCVVSPAHVHQTMRRSVLRKFSRTPPPSGPQDARSKRVYALDCEMVYTTFGMSVARLSVVDINDELVLDIVIRPTEKVIDCNTKFSGLTDEMLEAAECDLNEAWKRFFELVNSETILVGHSLESDLRALRLVHRNVVDTSVVFPHRLGPPMKRALRNLASDYLQLIIQEDTEGHCSKEDAGTCMKLMLHKTRTDLGIPSS